MRLVAGFLFAFQVFAQLAPPPLTLRGIFNLTPDQVQKISGLFADYNSFVAAKNARMLELNRDLQNQLGQPALDAVRIGADYAEAETIRRDVEAKQTSYRTQWRATLTPAQQMQYQTLLNGITLQPLLSEAGCAFLIDRIEYVPTSALRSGNFSSFQPGFRGVLLPDIPPPPRANFCGSAVFPLALREYLNVTDVQVAALVQANADYRDIYERRQQRIAEVQIEIRDENAKERPDPMALGVRYVELQLLARDLQYQESQLIQRARAALTGDQAVRLKALDDLAASSRSLSVLDECDLVMAPPGSQYRFGFDVFIPTTNPLATRCLVT